MKELLLNSGEVILIDDNDYSLVSLFKWSKTSVKKGTDYHYLKTSFTIDNKRYSILLHRLIMNAKKGQIIDHINRNSFDNRKINLRFCSNSENTSNGKMRKSKSGYKGVCWYKPYNKWVIKIYIKGRYKFLGYTNNPIEGAKLYNKYAQIHLDNYSTLNLI